MAVSLISGPAEFQPAYNPIEFVLDSTNKARCQFRYVVNVYVNGNLAATQRYVPEGDDDYGYARVEAVISDYLSFDIDRGLSGFAGADNSWCSYYIEVKERYNTDYATDCLGEATESAVAYTSSTLYAWNGVLSYDEFPSYDSADFVPSDSTSRFLGSYPTRLTVSEDATMTLNFLQDGSAASDVGSIQIETYTSAGVSVGTYFITNTESVLADARVAMVGVGPLNLNTATLASGSQPVIGSTVDYYTVHLVDSGLSQISEQLRFDVDRTCNRYKRFRLWWLNKLGGFDSFTFTLNHKRSVNINRSTMSRPLPSSYTVGDRGDSVVTLNASETYTITSGYMSEEESLWIEDLWTSPEVYMLATTATDYDITGVAYNAGTASFIIDAPGTIAPSTYFEYVVDDGSPIGMANSGVGFIRGFAGGLYTSTVPATINAGALITGTATVYLQEWIPVVVTSNTFEEKRKPEFKNITHTVTVRAANNINVNKR